MESSPIQGRRSSIQEGRFQREGRGRPRRCFRGETKRRFNRAAWQMSREEAAATAAGAQKVSAQAGFTTQSKTGNTSAAPPVVSHLRPFRARANPGEAASINSNHRPRHQVKPHRWPLHLCVAPQTLVSPLRPHLHPPLRLRALTVLEDSCGACLDSRRGSSRQPPVVVASRKAATGGSAQQKRRTRRKVSPQVIVPLARGGGTEGGGQHTDVGRASAAWRFICPTVLQREAKQAPPRPSQQAPLTGAISDALASVDPIPPTSTSCGRGRRDRGRGRGGNRVGAPPPADS